jgi:diguanylate cyclase (GGDEF)-like protein
MDVITAGIALILVQLCVALVMAGIFHAAPAEKCTRYWALSGSLVAVGILLIVLNAGALRYPILIVGNNALIIGIVLQWCGIRAFYRKAPGYAGWGVALGFFVLYAMLLWRHAPTADRATLSGIAILALLLLNFFEVWTGRGSNRSFATVLILVALALLAASYTFRVVTSLANILQFLPNTRSPLEVTLLYLTPIVGTLLLSNGLLLLYFERVVADKHHLATHDELTALLNRRAIVSAGERETSLATRLGMSLTVAFADIDHFKKINDVRGHEAGDRAIAAIASALRKSCRNVDLVGRYGGEEFCLIFPGVDRAGAAVVGERLLQTVRKHTGGRETGITISVGLATLSPADRDRSWATLIRRADTELYNAKHAGRDRCCFAPDSIVADASMLEPMSVS